MDDIRHVVAGNFDKLMRAFVLHDGHGTGMLPAPVLFTMIDRPACSTPQLPPLSCRFSCSILIACKSAPCRWSRVTCAECPRKCTRIISACCRLQEFQRVLHLQLGIPVSKTTCLVDLFVDCVTVPPTHASLVNFSWHASATGGQTKLDTRSISS